MLILQEKLFFRSNVRKILLAVLVFGGLIYHLWIFRDAAMDGIYTYGYIDHWIYQTYLFVYYFILLLFLSYDYFREVPNAELLDIVKVSGSCIKSDLTQFLVMLQWVLLSAGMMFGFLVYGFYISDTLTGQVVFYACRLVFLYIALNGIMAVMLAWLLSWTVGKLVGYICIILFSCSVSPIATSGFGYLSMVFRELHDMSRFFLIMPEGLNEWFPGTLLPVNLSIVSRTFFWILLFLLGLLLSSRSLHKKWLVPIIVLCIAGDFTYMYLPASYYSGNDSYGVSDSQLYDQMAYMIDETVAGKEEDGFLVASYKMEFNMGRLMEATVSVVPVDGSLSKYKMTLYHLYDVKSVTDENGVALSYERNGDYLTVYNQAGSLGSICIDYRGALANFYANAEMINLPGWFAYYPIPGYHSIYQDYEYMDNWLEEDVYFDILVDTRTKVYSDLNRVEGNHFAGESCGVTLVSGFFKEMELENGIHCIYPYLDKLCDPAATVDREDKEYVLEYLDEMWADKQEKTVIILPVAITGVEGRIHDSSLIGNWWWRSLARNLRETGNLLGEEKDTEMNMEQLGQEEYKLILESR